MLNICKNISIGSIRQGSLLNQPPAILKDGNTVSRYDRTISSGVVKDANGVESIYWDLMTGNQQRGAEQVSGNIILYAVYEITACQTDFFYAGCAVGDIFPCGVVKTCSATNKVKRVLGNHLTQPIVAKRPINGIFDGVDDFMKAASFTLIQPEAIFSVVKVNQFVSNRAIFDGNTNFGGLQNMSGYLGAFASDTKTPRATLEFYAGAYPFSNSRNANINIGAKIYLKAVFNGASSEFKIGGHPTLTGNAGSSNMNGLTIGTTGGIGSVTPIHFSEMIVRKSFVSADETSIKTYLTRKHKLRKFAFIGDSTISFANSDEWHSCSSLMSINHHAMDLSYPGATIDNQNTSINTYLLNQELDAVIVQIGLNDLIGTSATIVSSYQALIDNLRSNVGAQTKIIISTMVPCNRANPTLNPTEGPQWQILNTAIKGGGATPITDIDGIVDNTVSVLNAGNDTLNPIYDIGDGVHPNDAGRLINIALWESKLKSFGF